MKWVQMEGKDLTVGMRVNLLADSAATISKIEPYEGPYQYHGDRTLSFSCIHSEDDPSIDGSRQVVGYDQMVKASQIEITTMSFIDIVAKELVGKNLFRMGEDKGTITDVTGTIGGAFRVYVGKRSYVVWNVEKISVAF